MIGHEINRDAYVAQLAEVESPTPGDLVRADYWLDIALEDSFPCSDPISSMRID